MDTIGREAIPQGKNAFVFTRLLHSVRNDIFYCVIAGIMVKKCCWIYLHLYLN